MNITKRGMATGLCLACLAGHAWSEDNLTVSVGMDFTTGKYGATESTDIWYIPLTAKYQTGSSTLKLTLPYLQVTAPSGGVLIGVDDNGHPIYSGAGARTTEKGMGDMVLAYTYSLFEAPVHGIYLDLTSKAKIGTADEKRGLGTGKNDYAAQADAYYLAGAWTPFMTLGYRWLGDPTGIDLRNIVYGSLGLTYKHSPRNSFGGVWDIHQGTLSGRDGSNEATLYWTHKYSTSTKLQTYAIVGFSDASPSWGMGMALSHTY